MADFFCIYSGRTCPEDTRSVEHIIPFSLGGTDRFVTRDVARSANNDVGTRVDAAMINNFFMGHERWLRGLRSADGHVPPLEFRGTVDIQGKPVRATFVIRPDRSSEIRLAPEVKSDWTDLKFSVACDPADLPRIAADIEKKAKSKGLPFKLLDHEVHRQAVSIPQPSMESGFSFDMTSMLPGFIKIALGSGHWVLGAAWSSSTHADLLRAAINAPEPADWTKFPIHGSAWPHTGKDMEGLRTILFAGDDRHVVMVSNQNPLGCVILLFGKYDAMVQLAPGVWPSKDLPAGKARVIVVDSKTREMWTFELGEFIAKKQNGTLPFTIP
jgi:hypothetical protein